MLDGTPLSITDSIRDLGVIFCADLSFVKYIQAVSSRAFKKLGFVMRSFKYFNNINTLRLLFCSLVRPQLEYAVIVWASYQIKYCAMIEKIQYRFLTESLCVIPTTHMILC